MTAMPRSKEALLESARQLGVTVPWSDDTAALRGEVRIGARSLSNRFVALPMEGCDCMPDGAPSQITVRRYNRVAAGGSAIIWFEAAAVEESGRSGDRALLIADHTLDALGRLTDSVRQTCAAAGTAQPLLLLQLTHAGRFARVGAKPNPAMVHRVPLLDSAQGFGPEVALVSDDWLAALEDRFVDAAGMALKAGFDGVDIKACHGYLVSSILGAHSREGKFGGSYENRTRFVREVVEGVRSAHPSCITAVRMNAWDGLAYPYGWGVDPGSGGIDLTEPRKLVQDLAALGAHLVSVSAGLPRYDPHINRPSARYGGSPAESAEHAVVGVARLCGIIGDLQRSQPRLPMVTAGLAWCGHLMPHVAAGMVAGGDAVLVGQGRGTFAYPESVRDILDGGSMDARKVCVSCSRCSELMKSGGPAGCPVRDREMYPAQQAVFSRA